MVGEYGLPEVKCFSSDWHIHNKGPELVTQVCNSAIWKAKAGVSQGPGQPLLQVKFKTNLGNTVRPPSLKQRVKRVLRRYRSGRALV